MSQNTKKDGDPGANASVNANASANASAGANAKQPTEEDIFGTPEPHHISDMEMWQHADLNYFIFVALTFLFGFVGLDHMYLRSNETAFKKLLLNVFGLGIWWIWDIIQVMKDGKLVRKHGLNSPFDWIRGIGRGMFVPLPADAPKGNNAGNKKEPPKEYAAPKSYFVYTLLAVFLGIFGADKFYMGQNWQGAAKLFSVFNIFLFLFGLLWVAWDAVHAYFMTKSVMEDGITPPIPYSWFFQPIKTDVFKVQEVKEGAQEEAPKSFGFSLPGISIFRDAYRELVVPILQPTVGTAIANANKAVSVGTKVVALGTTALGAAPTLAGTVGSDMEKQADAAAAAALQQQQQPLGTTVGAVQSVAAAAQANRAQTGGGSHDYRQPAESSSHGPGPILAGAFTAILLAGGLKGFYDFAAKQVAA